MDLNVINIFLSILLLIVLPICIGNTICYFLKQDNALSKCFITGHITMWAICQLVAVPLILLKQSFLIVVVLLSFFYGGIFLYSIINHDVRKGFKTMVTGLTYKDMSDGKGKAEKTLDMVSFVIMVFMVLFIVVASIVLQHTDADDSRFVVNAVDIYRTNRMLLTDVNTGNAISTFLGDLNKDVTSPDAVYIAYISRLTGIYPSIMMHTIFPPVIMIMLGVIYWILSEYFFGKEILYRSIFVCFAILLNIFGYHSFYASETFIMTRMWQGKATLAGVGIPVMLWIFLELYKNENKESYIMLIIADMAMCLLSNMGVIICGIMLGCFGIAYGIIKKSFKITAFLWLMCIINVVYIGISYVM